MLLLVARATAQTSSDELLRFLNQTIDWYQRVAAFDHAAVSSDEVLYRDTVVRSSRQALQTAFAYAEAQAQLLAGSEGAGASSQSTRLAHALAAATQRVTQIQTSIAKVDADLPNGSPSDRVTLQAKRDELAAELNLAQVRLSVLHDLAGFTAENAGGSAGIVQKIADLRASVPEAQAGQPGTPATQPAAAVAAEPPFRAESTGILGLVTEMFSLTHEISEIKGLAAHTATLREENEKLRTPLRIELLQAIRQGDVLAQTRPADDPALLAAARRNVETLTARYKLLAAAAIPLSEQSTYLEATRNGLLQWRSGLDRRYARTLRFLLIRIGAMVAAIFVLLVISKLWRRATFRYVTDVRRRRQFLLIRRLIVGGIVVVIIVAGVVTEFGSLATYAGLLTAGIAVALQTVILSGVAHFFFLGRYGVRVGDRVTISDITGDVIDIGIFRLYLMELGGKNSDLQPTGRIVVFSNSVLFQPSAFFKQIPGAEYNWHEMALTLSPDSDYHLAETRLLEAVESVYADYRAEIERQHELAKDSLHVQLAPPKPEGRLRLVDAGLEFVVRYPVEIRRAAEIDDRITRKLLDTIEKEPKLRLVASATPSIQSADGHT